MLKRIRAFKNIGAGVIISLVGMTVAAGGPACLILTVRPAKPEFAFAFLLLLGLVIVGGFAALLLGIAIAIDELRFTIASFTIAPKETESTTNQEAA